jgi:hypothetical protein
VTAAAESALRLVATAVEKAWGLVEAEDQEATVVVMEAVAEAAEAVNQEARAALVVTVAEQEVTAAAMAATAA